MNLQLIGGMLGLIIHIPLLSGIWKGNIKQSFASYGLWSLLDFIAAYAIFKQDGNFWLPFLYAIGAGLAAMSLLFKKCFSWGLMEWLVLTLVGMCMYVQYTSGEFYAMILSVASLAIASIPQIIDTWRKPGDTPTRIYMVFCFANLLSLLGAKSFELEQILYAITALIICVLIVLFSIRKNPRRLIDFFD
jgi:hypothetical protein